jgi:ABC-type multidrug transport system permease subunit
MIKLKNITKTQVIITLIVLITTILVLAAGYFIPIVDVNTFDIIKHFLALTLTILGFVTLVILLVFREKEDDYDEN